MGSRQLRYFITVCAQRNLSRAADCTAVPMVTFGDLFRPPYLSLVVMFMVFSLCQAFGFYGFAN